MKLLKDQDGMTATEVCKMLSIDRKSFNVLVARARKKGRVYISEYVESDTPIQTTKVAVYCVGDKEDATPPAKQRRQDIKRRYDQRVRVRNRTNSVFNLAMPRHQYTIGAKT